MSKIAKHISKLGSKATDKVTGFSGTITSISFDLYGCIQYIIMPSAKEGAELKDCHWFDVGRVEIHDERAMDCPDFEAGPVAEGKKGPTEKPIPG